jgi:hypothetical protein
VNSISTNIIRISDSCTTIWFASFRTWVQLASKIEGVPSLYYEIIASITKFSKLRLYLCYESQGINHFFLVHIQLEAALYKNLNLQNSIKQVELMLIPSIYQITTITTTIKPFIFKQVEVG